MSEDNSKDYNLVEEVPEDISTDSVADLKSGIYNLFISLFNELTIRYGPEESIKLSTAFLDEISLNFKSILDKNIRS
jgi:hypothetical protein